ncbi:MAG: glycoside hydrolase family 2 protein [Promethearchaeota archaeon]
MDSQEWKVIPAPLMTKWADEVDSNNPLSEYPRPQMVRDSWLNLNGLWEYAVSPKNINSMPTPEGKILVPFPLESALSGVSRQLYPKELLWYRRSFQIPKDWKKKRIILHFGAVDWEATVFVNGEEVGMHRGGYTPFSFDISSFVDYDSTNSLEVKVYDPSEKGCQPSGKQWLKPSLVFYTTISGIWQTVWLEAVSDTYIHHFQVTPQIETEQLQVKVWANVESRSSELGNANSKSHVEITISDKYSVGKIISTVEAQFETEILIDIPSPHLWSPEDPYLYGLSFALIVDDKVVDKVDSYFAMRKFSLEPDSKGHARFHLNGSPYFMIGPLDQGYWPDGLYTAPTDEALRYDLEIIKECGYNMVRKHIKVEPARWYHHCDTMGLIVWQDMPNGGGKSFFIHHNIMYLLHINPRDDRRYWFTGQGKQWIRDNFKQELGEMIDMLYNVPSIAIWGPFNEAWGQFDTVTITNWIKSRDDSRLIDSASGWYDKKCGDFLSIHDYMDKFIIKVPPTSTSRGIVLSETGGYTYPVERHRWDPKKKFGYKKFKSEKDMADAYTNLVEKIIVPAISQGLSGVVYTQITDVEIEYNGIMTYDRKILKFKLELLAELHRKLISQLGSTPKSFQINKMS